jgi:hypothetical protein
MFPGIADRMQKELTALAPASVKVCPTLRCCSFRLLSFGRSRFWPLRNANIQSGLVAQFWLPSVLSRMLGALNKNMTRVVLPSFIAVSVLITSGFSD